MLNKIKKFLGLEKYSPYVKAYFERSNVRSSIYLSSVIISLEVFMILSVIRLQFFSPNPRTMLWFYQHMSCYIVLLLSGVSMLVYAILYTRGKKTSPFIEKLITTSFSLISIVFGMYISYLDYLKGEQFITLFTMMLFIFCFLLWRPIYSIFLLSVSFISFYILCDKASTATYATQVNLTIILIAILMAAINSFHQKIKEARKDEKLERANEVLFRVSISDEVTGMSNMNYFRAQTLEKLHDKKTDITKMLFLFLDIEHFKNYNEKCGFMAGNIFLREFGNRIEEIFADSITAHFSNDNFVIFTKDENIQENLELLSNEIKKKGHGIAMELKTGAFRPENSDCLPVVACDHARYACYSIKKQFDKNYCEYSEDMNFDFHRKQHIINNIENAIENNYIKIYYQPFVNAKTGEVSGYEALARWDDPEFGFLMPSLFINTLEEYHQIHKLDMYVLNNVCIDLSIQKKLNKPILPVSLNFSRLDFEVLDLVNEVESTLNYYNLDKKCIHVEITESALSENDEKLQSALKKFRSSGYELWLDDFGSGYSGLNVLKEYEFDVMKIDMKFLQNFGKNEKAKSILKNIVTLAKDIGMKTLTEGVETEEAREFLRDIGCEKLQGYLFGKPMPKNDQLFG